MAQKTIPKISQFFGEEDNKNFQEKKQNIVAKFISWNISYFNCH
jgi:hypothetical protein